MPWPAGYRKASTTKGERRRVLATAGVIEVIARVGRAPVGEDPHQFAVIEVPPNLLFGQMCQAKAGEGRFEDEGRGVEDAP